MSQKIPQDAARCASRFARNLERKKLIKRVINWTRILNRKETKSRGDSIT